MTSPLPLVVAGGCLILLGSALLYLASPNQRLGSLPLAPRLAGWGGAAFLIVGASLILGWAGAATTIFIAMTLVMTAWSILPLAVAWARRDRETGQ